MHRIRFCSIAWFCLMGLLVVPSVIAAAPPLSTRSASAPGTAAAFGLRIQDTRDAMRDYQVTAKNWAKERPGTGHSPRPFITYRESLMRDC